MTPSRLLVSLDLGLNRKRWTIQKRVDLWRSVVARKAENDPGTDLERYLLRVWGRCWNVAVVRARAGDVKDQRRAVHRQVGVLPVVGWTVAASAGGALPDGWDERKQKHFSGGFSLCRFVF